MDAEHSNGPEFISHAEWQVGRRKRRNKLLKSLSGLLAVGMACLSGLILARIASASAERARFLGALDHIRDYRAEIKLIDINGARVPFRTESVRGEDWQVSSWAGELVCEKRGPRYVTCEPHFGRKVSYGSSNGVRFFLDELRGAAKTASPWRLSEASFQMAHDSSGVTLLVTRLDRRYRIFADPNTLRPQLVSVEDKGFDGWKPSESVALNYDVPPLAEPVPELRAMPAAEAGSFSNAPPLAAFSTDLGVSTIRAADINTRGDAFFLVDGMHGVSIDRTDGIMREGEDRTYNVTVSEMPVTGRPGKDHLTLLQFRAIDSKKVKWPTTLDVKINVAGARNALVAQFLYKFSKPTCFLMPSYQVAVGGDQPYYEYLYNANVLLTPLASGLGATPIETLVSIDNAILYNRVLYREGENSDATDDLIRLWRDAYAQLKSLSHFGQARNALSMAREILDRHPFEGSLATEIRDLSDQEGIS